MSIKEKYTDDESHFATRITTVLIIVLVFILQSILFINPNGRSCLGPPSLLPFGFFGLPLLFFLSIIDLIVLVVLKAFQWQKLFINLGMFFFVILFLLFILNG
jgi:hypothetical protein